MHHQSQHGPRSSNTETDPRFPSGQWTGFWLQRAYIGRQWMSLHLRFADEMLSGGGSDCVGDFDMDGTYNLVSGSCSIIKKYHSAHRVLYDGRNDGDGLWIWGVWRIGTTDRGGFHLWPAGEEDPTGKKLQAERETDTRQPGKLVLPDELREPVPAKSG